MSASGLSAEPEVWLNPPSDAGTVVDTESLNSRDAIGSVDWGATQQEPTVRNLHGMTFRAKKPATIITALALALGAPVALSGCLGNPLGGAPGSGVEDAPASGTDDAVSGDTGSDSGAAEASLPADFPTEVPVPEGTIEIVTSATIDTGKGWIMKISSDDPDVYEKIRKQMAGAGFEQTVDVVTELRSTGAFQSDRFVVMVAVTDQKGKKAVSFQVSEYSGD